MKYLLYPFALLYGIAITIRNLFFDFHIIHQQRFQTWVVSIGNLSVGGTGKSPHTEYIARLLDDMTQTHKELIMPFKKIAALSRGYGRVSKGFMLVNDSSNAHEVGDEPIQLKKRLKDIHVAVDENRAKGIKKLLALDPWIKVVILDDAFQHRYVKSDLSILLTNYYSPFYKDHLLPVGRLREPRKGYKRARIIIVTNTPENISDVEKENIIREIHPRRKQKVFFSSIVYQALVPVFHRTLPAPVIGKQYSVLLLTGIANADSLHAHLAGIARDAIHIPFPDHHIFQQADVAKVITSFNAIINPEKIIITTEKDAMRLQTGDLINSFGTVPVYYIPIQVKVHKEEHLENAIISRLGPSTFAMLVNKSDTQKN